MLIVRPCFRRRVRAPFPQRAISPHLLTSPSENPEDADFTCEAHGACISDADIRTRDSNAGAGSALERAGQSSVPARTLRPETARRLTDELLFERGVQSYLWALPAINMWAMKQASEARLVPVTTSCRFGKSA